MVNAGEQGPAVGDKVGRVKAMGFSILAYSVFTGACYFATEPWHLAVFRFLAALGTLRRHGPMTPSQLASHESIKRPSATAMIARMEELGYATRTPDPRDGRSCSVTLTSEGEQLVVSSRRRRDEYLARSLAQMDAAERTTLAAATELLERMLAQDGCR